MRKAHAPTYICRLPLYQRPLCDGKTAGELRVEAGWYPLDNYLVYLIVQCPFLQWMLSEGHWHVNQRFTRLVYVHSHDLFVCLFSWPSLSLFFSSFSFQDCLGQPTKPFTTAKDSLESYLRPHIPPHKLMSRHIAQSSERFHHHLSHLRQPFNGALMWQQFIPPYSNISTHVPGHNSSSFISLSLRVPQDVMGEMSAQYLLGKHGTVENSLAFHNAHYSMPFDDTLNILPRYFQ